MNTLRGFLIASLDQPALEGPLSILEKRVYRRALERSHWRPAELSSFLNTHFAICDQVSSPETTVLRLTIQRVMDQISSGGKLAA